MAEIYPNGTIQFYNGIRLDNTYQNALSFANIAERENFFANTSHLKRTVQAQSYTRVTNGVCDVQIAIGEMYDVNYMRFQNTGFSSKWFYAFVKNVEYLNNISSRVYFEIDVLTTFYFDWGYLPSFVEREHAADDTIGANLVEEPVKFGEPIAFAYQRHYFRNFYAMVAYSDYDDIGGERRAFVCKSGDMLNACYIEFYSIDTTEELRLFQKKLSDFSESEKDFINIFLFPKELFNIQSDLANGQQTFTFRTYIESITRPNNINGYTPRNNKLFTYPYCYLCVDNGTITNNYRWELFHSESGFSMYSFIYRGVPMPTPQIYVAPLAYKGVQAGSNYNPCYEERLELNGLPQVAFPIDSYGAWLAQTESSRQNKVITGVAAGVGSGMAAGAKFGTSIGAAGGPIGAGAGAVGGAIIGGVIGAIGAKVANDMAVTEAADMKNKSTGTGSAGVGIADGKCGYIFKKMGVTYQDAQIIDSFFDMFGYAVNRIKTPQIRTRAHWNYIKTNGCNMNQQNVPADYVARIKAIHDNGVTYWKNHDEIGNYNLNNYITG